MTVRVVHPFVSAIPDSGDASIVQPSNWNADHTIVGLGTAAEANTADFATAAQGAKADTALQPAAIGVTVQAWDAQLDLWSAVTPASYLTTTAAAAAYQPLDADLTAWAGVNPSSYSTTAQIAAAYQPLDSDLTAWAGVNPSSYSTSAQIALAYQPLDSDLTSWAGVTRASGFDTFAATPSSANLRALLSDEVGTGAAYFVGGALGTPASATLTNATGLPNASVIGLGTAALKNTGTSGNTVPLLDAASLTFSSAIVVQAPAAASTLSLTETNDVAPTAGAMVMRRARGTVAVPTAVLSGDTIAGLNARGYGATAFSSLGRASFSFRASENWTDTEQGTDFVLETTITGGTSRASRLTATGVGLVSTTTSCFGRGAPVTKTADFTVAVSENWLINNKSGSTCTVTLPAASSFTGREIMFKNSQAQTMVSASSNVVPRVTAAAGTAILASGSGQWCTMVSDGTNWIIMAGS